MGGGEGVKKSVELVDLDWEDRERVLRLLFSKMNSGMPASNWRVHEGTSHMGRTTGYGSNKANVLNQSFRQEEEEEGEEGEEEDGEENQFGLAMVREEEGGMFGSNP